MPGDSLTFVPIKNWRNDNLSVTIVNEGANVFLMPESSQRVRRLVYIDGPSVGQSYDPNYSLGTHLYFRNNYVRQARKKGRCQPLSSRVAKFPVSSLTKLLFYFIQRGHRTTAFLPTLYNERNFCGEIVYDVSSLISDAKELRMLVSLGLIEFLREEEDFGKAVRSRAKQLNGVVVTTSTFMISESCKNDLDGQRLLNASVALSIKEVDTRTPVVFPDHHCSLNNHLKKKSKRPFRESVLVPVFYSFLKQRGFIICSFTLSEDPLPLRVEDTLLEIKSAGDNSLDEQIANQLTLSEQYFFLETLSNSLSDHYNGAPCFREVFRLLKSVMIPSDFQKNTETKY